MEENINGNIQSGNERNNEENLETGTIQEGSTPDNPYNVTPKVIQDINNRILEIKAEIKKAKKTKYSFLIMSVLFAIPILLKYSKIISIHFLLEIVLWALSILIFIAFISYTKVEESIQQMEHLELKKISFYQFAGLEQPKTYFESLVNINIENLGDYYHLVKIHTNRSFRASLVVSILGFILIVLGLIVTYANPKFQNISYIVSSSGAIIELISGLFFYLYIRTVRQLKEYHDSLLKVQNILLSFKLVEGIENSGEKSEMIKTMLQSLVK